MQLLIDNTVVKQVDSFTFLGSTISSDLSWENNTASMVKKGQQRMYFLRQLNKFGISPSILKRFYHAVIESVLTSSITVWFGRASYEEKTQLETLVRCASKIIGLTLPTIEWCVRKSKNIVRKSKNIVRAATHPANHLFKLLQSGKRYKSVNAKTTRFRNSFYLEVIIYLLYEWRCGIVFQMNPCSAGTQPFITFECLCNLYLEYVLLFKIYKKNYLDFIIIIIIILGFNCTYRYIDISFSDGVL